MDHLDHDDRSPAIAELLDDAYSAGVDVETAARHLWVIHREADRIAREAEATPPVEPVPSLAGHRVPRAAIPLLVAVMAMSSSGMALAASRSSLPGDVLYPVKRGTESAQLVFARDPATRAQLQLAFAQTRLEELRRIGRSRPQHVPSLVGDITASLAEVEQSAPESAPASERLRRETTTEIAALELPGDITQAVDQAMTATPASSAVATTSTAPSPQGARTQTSAQPTTGAGATAAVDDDGATAADGAPTAAPSASTGGSAVPGSAGPSAEGGADGSEDAQTEGAGTEGETAQGGSAEPSAGAGGEAEGATPTGQSSAGGSAAPGEGTATAKPVVTPRPHPSGEGGASRSDEGDEGTAPEAQGEGEQAEGEQTQGQQGQGEPATEGGDQSTSGGEAATPAPVLPYTRPGS